MSLVTKLTNYSLSTLDSGLRYKPIMICMITVFYENV